MAHGKKTGGRKKGTQNARTKLRLAAVDDALSSGSTPLEVMLKAMRAHSDGGRLDQAAAIAKDAAPYMHHRLAAIEHTGKDGEPLKVSITAADAEL